MGTDVDGDEIYAGRAPHEGDILPAKVIPNKNACYVCWGGEEIVKDQFEVIIGTNDFNGHNSITGLADSYLVANLY